MEVVISGAWVSIISGGASLSVPRSEIPVLIEKLSRTHTNAYVAEHLSYQQGLCKALQEVSDASDP